MDGVLIDNMVVFFAVVYYAFLVMVYLVRAHNLSDLELKMAPIFSVWYRLITRKKPVHHPDRWPIGLVVYLVLLFIGCIGLNWYGFLVSDFYGNILVVSFFVMMSSFGYYQYQYRKGKKA